ncbi:MAG: methyltransferase domain-containing protein [Gammaproteobacteria bacterium]|nr:methyltransferase domain-containing protein [Gammaproteobacteria bacterium]
MTQPAIDFKEVFGKEISPEFQEILSTVFKHAPSQFEGEQIEFEGGEPISAVRGIPRFVSSDNYTESFSYQWLTYTNTQLDSAQASQLTEQDLRNKTGLTPEAVRGKLVLDAGVGIGRHSELLASWGAYVIGIDLSQSVESAQENLKKFPNAVVMQCDISQLPFNPQCFDHIVSIGVLHHTPDTRKYTEYLMPYLKTGGRMSIWLYSPVFNRRGEWVPLVSRLPLPMFKEWSEWIVDIARNNKGNRLVSAFIKQFPFSTHHPTAERSVLALFDGYTPTFHWTHTPEEVVGWFNEAGFTDIRVGKVETAVSGVKA